MGEDRQSVGGNPEPVNEPPEAEWPRLLCETASGASGNEMLTPLARHAVTRCGASHAVALLGRDDKFTVLGSWGLDSATERSTLLRYARQLAAWVAITRVPLTVDAPASDARFPDPPPALTAASAWPWPADGLSGGLVVFGGAEADPSSSEALRALACLGALVLRGEVAGRRARELDARTLALEKQLVAAERLAAVGELAAEMSREIKAPLTGLGTLAGQAALGLPEDDARRPLLEVLVQEAARLERILAGQLELVERVEPVLAPEDLNRVVGECLMLVSQEFRDGRIRLTRRLGPGLPALLLDADFMRRVVLSLLRGGMETCPRGGRVKVETRRAGSRVELTVAADGAPRPGQALEHLWRPFEVGGAAGTRGNVTAQGIQRILREHRGALRARSTSEWPFHVTLTLPIAGNRDRRRTERERRSGRERRTA